MPKLTLLYVLHPSAKTEDLILFRNEGTKKMETYIMVLLGCERDRILSFPERAAASLQKTEPGPGGAS